jgi:hypothetical protein
MLSAAQSMKNAKQSSSPTNNKQQKNLESKQQKDIGALKASR